MADSRADPDGGEECDILDLFAIRDQRMAVTGGEVDELREVLRRLGLEVVGDGDGPRPWLRSCGTAARRPSL